MVDFPSMFYKILTQIRVNLLYPCYPCSLFHKTKRCVHTVAPEGGGHQHTALVYLTTVKYTWIMINDGDDERSPSLRSG